MISIGVDGGGTKTAFLCDRDGEKLSLVLREPANPNTVGYEKSADVICRGIKLIASENGFSPDAVNGVFCGIAGATNGGYMAFCKDAVRAVCKNAAVDVAHDGHNILSAAFGMDDGVIVICGTGSSCFVRKRNVLSRIGGYLSFDVAGCGYEIGRAAIAHSLCCFDGREKSGKLCELVDKKLSMPPLDALDSLLKADRSRIADFAITVFDAYDDDPYARAILEANMKFIAGYIDAAALHFDGAFSVCIAGSIGTNPLSLKLIRGFLHSNAEIFPLEAEPVCGALIIAKTLSERRNNT